MPKDVFADPRIQKSDSLAHNAMVSLSHGRKLLNDAAELRYVVAREIEPERAKIKSQFALDSVALFVRARDYRRAKVVAKEFLISDSLTIEARTKFTRVVLSFEDELKEMFPEW